MSAAPFSDEQRAEAVDLVRSLASLAGDEQRVVDLLESYNRLVGYTHAVEVCAVALAVTFGSCMTSPVSLDTGEQVPVHVPDHQTAKGTPTS